MGRGTYNVSFDISVEYSGAGIMYAKVYVNGTAVGTQRSKSTTGFTTYTESFSGPLAAGSKIQLYGYYDGDPESEWSGLLRYFRLKYDLSVPTSFDSTSTTY